MNWEKKIWGWTRETGNERPLKSTHELLLERGGFCSLHYHVGCNNKFEVTAGVVRVVWSYGGRLGAKIIEPGEGFFVPANLPHQFQVIQDGSMIEIYEPVSPEHAVKYDDIVRLTIGGKVPEAHVDVLFSSDTAVVLDDSLKSLYLTSIEAIPT